MSDKNSCYIVLMYIPVLLSLIIVCNNPTGYQKDVSDDFLGQIEVDIDYAILKPNGSVWTWGTNSTGQLGNGTMEPSLLPKQIQSLENIMSMDLCDGGAFAWDGYGNVWFWGNRIIWEESPNYDTTVVTPAKISFLPEAKQIQVRGSNIYLLKENGTVWELEWNHRSPTKYISPEKIEGLIDIKQISGCLALKNDNVLCEFPDRAWIEPENGGLGEEIIDEVECVQNVSMSHSIIMKNDGTIWAWGKDKGGYWGNGTYNDNPNPSEIDSLDHVISLSVNGSRCLALKNDGTVWFWGMIDVDLDQDIKLYQNHPILLEGINCIKMIHASAAGSLLFMKNDYSYWTYDLISSELVEIQF